MLLIIASPGIKAFVVVMLKIDFGVRGLGFECGKLINICFFLCHIVLAYKTVDQFCHTSGCQIRQ